MPTDENQHLLEIHRKRLAVLEQQRATFGDAHAPAYLLVEIEDLKEPIAALEAGSKPDLRPRAGAVRFLALVAAPLVYRTAHGDQPITPLALQEELDAIAAACKRVETPVALDIQVEIATVDTIGRVFATSSAQFDILHFRGIT